jgi:hypothetical protein
VLHGEDDDDNLLGGSDRDVLDGGEGANSNSGGPDIDICRNPKPAPDGDCER